MKRIVQWVNLVAAMIMAATVSAQDAAQTPGLNLTLQADGGKSGDTAPASNIWLYVENGKPPSPFVAPGKFTATWEGAIAVELRGEYSFIADLNGALKLEVNGESALDVAGKGSLSTTGKVVRLNKGPNKLKATYSSPAQGDAYVRLLWKPKDSLIQTIPASALTRSENAQAAMGVQLRVGRDLFLEHRCVRCHTGPKETDLPDLALDAPSFQDIGARRATQWMAKWIESPKGSRAIAQMPKMVHGATAKEDAAAMAAFLGSLKGDTKPVAYKAGTAESLENGKKLFETLHCAGCHSPPEAADDDAAKVSLKQVREKFVPSDLPAFLKNPSAHYAWIRMPQFKLTDEQRDQLSAYLLGAEAPAAASDNGGKDAIEKGRKLIQSQGCLNCHAAKLENSFKAASLDALKWTDGCLAEKETEKAPFFAFTAEQRQALQAFGKTDRASLTRHVPAEFADRQVRNLNCLQCHGQVEGVPHLEILGEKLRPEWATKFIAGEVAYKPRPWLESQMPAFPKYAEPLARGMAAQHGIAPKSPVEPAVDKAMAEVGNKLVSAPPHGFSCVSCHSLGTYAATEVFEAPGINLGYSGERLLPEFAKRWIHNPTLIDPATKMPVYFDETGKSPLTDYYEGDAGKQIDALWHYIRLGEKMPGPKLAE